MSIAAARLVVLGLAQQVGGHPGGVGLAVGDDEYLARPGYHVYGHLAEDLALGLRDEGVAGADDLVHLRYRLGAVGERGHGLGPAHAEDAADARNLRRGEYDVADRPAAGGGGHDHLVHAGDPRGDAVHQHAAGVGRRAAGDVQAHALERDDPLAEQRAVFAAHDVAARELPPVELAYVLRRRLHDLQELRVHALIGRVQLGGRDLEGDALGAVKLRVVFHERGVAVLAHVGDDLGHDAAHARAAGHTADDFGIGDLPALYDLQHFNSLLPAQRSACPQGR